MSHAKIQNGYIEKRDDYDTSTLMNFIKNNLPSDMKIIYTIVPRGLVISVPSVEIFDEKSFEIKDGAKAFLIRIGNLIKHIKKPCVIEGNVLTQQENDELSNLELSIIRAETLVEFLLKNSGIPTNKIQSIGFGEMSPFDDNVSYKEHLNRRIDFVILNYQWSR